MDAGCYGQFSFAGFWDTEGIFQLEASENMCGRLENDWAGFPFPDSSLKQSTPWKLIIKTRQKKGIEKHQNN